MITPQLSHTTQVNHLMKSTRAEVMYLSMGLDTWQRVFHTVYMSLDRQFHPLRSLTGDIEGHLTQPIY